METFSLLLKKETKTDFIQGPGGFRQSQLPQKLLDVNRYQECFDGKKVIVSIFILLIYFP